MGVAFSKKVLLRSSLETPGNLAKLAGLSLPDNGLFVHLTSDYVDWKSRSLKNKKSPLMGKDELMVGRS